MREHVKRVGIVRLILIYLFVLVIIIIIEAFASLNIYLLEEGAQGEPVLREIFSMVAIIVAAFTVIANILFLGGRSKADREFHYYFRTRPLLIYSATAIMGDIIAVLLAGKTTYPYMVFYTSLIALNLFAIGFAIHAVEKVIRKGI